VDLRSVFPLSLTLADTHFTIHCHSPGGDAAAASSDRPTDFIIFSHHRATMRRPCRSLLSLRVLVSFYVS